MMAKLYSLGWPKKKKRILRKDSVSYYLNIAFRVLGQCLLFINCSNFLNSSPFKASAESMCYYLSVAIFAFGQELSKL